VRSRFGIRSVGKRKECLLFGVSPEAKVPDWWLSERDTVEPFEPFVGEDDPMTVWWESATVRVPARLGIVGEASVRQIGNI